MDPADGPVSEAGPAPPTTERPAGADGSERALHHIGGVWRESASKRMMGIRDPATGDPVGLAAIGEPTEAKEALEAAHRAFLGWADTPAEDRAGPLHRAAALIRERLDGIARLLTLEQGKPLPDARKEIVFSAEVIDYYAEEATRVVGEWRQATPGFRSLILRQPVGVIAAIAPWNYPVELLVWKIAPALAAGCTVVAKPAAEAPLAAAATVRCFEESGVPPGALNLVIGGPEVGEELVTNPLTRGVKITASTATGKRVMELAARGVKRVTLELGGQTPLIVLDDADLDSVVPAAIRRSYSNMGQVCVGVNRILASDRVADAFVESFADRARGLRLGHGLDPGVEYGPLFDEATRSRTERHVRDAVDRGARVVLGGGLPEGEAFARGFFYLPTMVTEASPEMLVMREETFGPVAAVARVRSDREAVDMANASPYGLAAYVFGRDLERCLRIAERLEAGGVGVNVNDVTELRAPFGGWKESGLGRELGPEGLEACLEPKHIRIRAEPTEGRS